jgi:hypothetical protein
MPLPLKTVLGQPSWSFHSSHVAAALTRQGGQLGPVTFRLGRKEISPLSVAPWAEEKHPKDLPRMLQSLRGDFFCAPFGGNAKRWRGEQHPPHGETANANWSLEGVQTGDGAVTLHASLATKIRRGHVDKFVTLIDGQTAVYQRHVLSGMSGPLNLGHHAMLHFPAPAGSGAISTSRFIHGQVFPGVFEAAENRGYQALKAGATFRSLDQVPLMTGGTTDLTRYPARLGYEDLVMMTADPKLPFAWTAVTFAKEKFVWFALRDPRQLRQTIFWISNGGRHYAPWSSRHTAVMGLEDVTSYFHGGIAESVSPNPLSRRGIPTSFQLNPKKPLEIRYLMAVAAIPAGFDRVKDIVPTKDGVELISHKGRRARCKVNLQFLQG